MFIKNLATSRPVLLTWSTEALTQMKLAVYQKQKVLTSVMTLHKLKTDCKYLHTKIWTPLAKNMLSWFMSFCNCRRLTISRDPLPMKFYFDFKWCVVSDAVQIRNIVQAKSMTIAEDKKEMGHRNFKRNGFCLIYGLHILSFYFRFVCSVPQSFLLWDDKAQWPETPVFTSLFISVYMTFYVCTHWEHNWK